MVPQRYFIMHANFYNHLYQGVGFVGLEMQQQFECPAMHACIETLAWQCGGGRAQWFPHPGVQLRTCLEQVVSGWCGGHTIHIGRQFGQHVMDIVNHSHLYFPFHAEVKGHAQVIVDRTPVGHQWGHGSELCL